MAQRINEKSIKSMLPKEGCADGVIFDDEVRGFGVRVTAKGTRSFIMDYRVPGRGQRRLTIGRYPVLSCTAARQAATTFALRIARGEDPLAENQAQAREMTVATLVERYTTEHVAKKRSAYDDKRRLAKFVLPGWKSRKVKSIKRADVAHLLSPIGANAPVEANRVLALVSGLFSFAVDVGIVDHHPCLRMKKPGGKEKPRRRTLETARELRMLWRITEGGAWRRYLKPNVCGALRLMLLTGCRPGEACGLSWDEIDLDAKTWLLPAERSKNGLEHLVPLSEEVVDLLSQQPQHGPWVFPAAKGGEFQENNLPKALRPAVMRLARLGIAPFTPHDLRRTVETGMAAARVPKEYRDRALNHKDASVGGVHYNRHDYLDEKREALEKWIARLRRMLNDEASNVVSLRSGQNA